MIRLMSREYVQPYVKAQKADDRDAEAIAEAVTRPTMCFASLKSEAQLDLQVLHRVRERLVLARTTLINQLRDVLLERDRASKKGRAILMRRLDEIDARTTQLFEDRREKCVTLDRRIKAYAMSSLP
jgi:transposase